MNLQETRYNLEIIYTLKLIEANKKIENKSKKNNNIDYWSVETVCHDYLQLGGIVNEKSPFNEVIARNPLAIINDFLSEDNKLTFLQAIERNPNLTIQEIRKCIATNASLYIQSMPLATVPSLVKVLMEFVQCGGILDELPQEDLKSVIKKIEQSSYCGLLTAIDAISYKNAERRFMDGIKEHMKR